MNTKQCTKCGEVKSVEDFPKDKRRADGRASSCRTCQAKLNNAWKARQEKKVGPRRAKIEAALVAGEKQCTKCGIVKPLSEYHKDKRSGDGHYSHCRVCHYQMTETYAQTEHGKEIISKSHKKTYWERGGKEKMRLRNSAPEAKKQRVVYATSDAGKAAQKRKDERRKRVSPEKLRAKNAVGHAVASGLLPPVNTLKCSQCGSQAEEYHHRSYALEDFLRVTPLCKKCHAKTYTQVYE